MMERTGAEQRSLRSTAKSGIAWDDRNKKRLLEYIIDNLLTDNQVERVIEWEKTQQN